MAFDIVHIVVWTSIIGICVSKELCNTGQYFDSESNTCASCSTRCPDNQVMRRPCTEDRDVVCGPLVELSEFFRIKSRDNFADNRPEVMPSRDVFVHTVHESDPTVLVLLLVLLGVTGLLIILALVALVMYRRRCTDMVEVTDPEKEIANTEEAAGLSGEYFEAKDTTVFIPNSLKPVK